MTTNAIQWPRATLMLLGATALAWHFISPDWPVLFDLGPSAQTKQAGKDLFVHQWEPHDPRAHGDGLGPVFNATSCVACHFQGGVGGGGDNVHNVTAYEIHPNLRDGALKQGLVHAFAVKQWHLESQDLLKNRYPIVPGGVRVVGGCTVRIEDFDPVQLETTNSIALFGDGLIDRISSTTVKVNHVRESLRQAGKEIGGNFNTIGLGRPHLLPDGRVGKFGWKAQFATLREFVAAACANELGLGNPLMEQAKPLGTNYRCDQADLTLKEFGQLVAFVDTLPRPVQAIPRDPADLAVAVRGEELFSSIGCAACHTPELGGVEGIYSDLLLHRVSSRVSDGYRHEVLVEIPLPTTHPEPDEWRTPPLWGVADSAPYFHDGRSPTLQAAILRHDGGSAAVTKAFQNLLPEDQQALIAFLKTLKAPANAEPFIVAQASPANR